MQAYKIYPIEHIIIEEVKLLPVIRVLGRSCSKTSDQVRGQGACLPTKKRAYSIICEHSVCISLFKTISYRTAAPESLVFDSTDLSAVSAVDDIFTY